MSSTEKVILTEGSLEDIADAIREKNGTETTYKPREMAPAIRALNTDTEWGEIGGTLSDQTDLQDALDTLNADLANLDERIDEITTETSIEDTEPYLFKPSMRENVTVETMNVRKIVGGTVAWNQLVQNGNFADTSGWETNRATVSVSDNVMTFNNIMASNPFARHSANALQKHKCILIVTAKATHNCSLNMQISNDWNIVNNKQVSVGTSWQTYYAVFDREQSANYVLLEWNISEYSSSDTVSLKNVQLIDLTQMFGSTIADYIYSLEQATAGAGVSWFRNLFPAPYYPYNAGELISVKTSAHVTRGFNQWDEEWEVGRINSTTGENQGDTSGNYFRSKLYIPTIPKTTLYCRLSDGFTTSTSNISLYFYRNDKTYIGRTANIATTPVEVPSDCSFIRFVAYYSTTQSIMPQGVCINLSDPSKNGTYEPYAEHSYPLDSDLELRGIPKLENNALVYDGDIYEASGAVTRKYGIVDLGTLTWDKNDSWGYYASVSDAKDFPYGASGNAVCSKYNSCNGKAAPDAGFFTIYGGFVRVADLTYSDAATFKTAMSGVMLVYELATPTTEQADAYTQYQTFDLNGTEEYVDTRTVPIPVGHDTLFHTSISARLDTLEDEMNVFGEGLNNVIGSIAFIENKVAKTSHAVGDYVILNGIFCKVIAAISSGETLSFGTNIQATTIGTELKAIWAEISA